MNLLVARVAFLLGLLPPSTLYILGDSNSCAQDDGCVTTTRWWPERMRVPAPFVIENHSRGGLTAGDYLVCEHYRTQRCTREADCPDGPCGPCIATDGRGASGPWRLAQLLEHVVGPDACGRSVPPKLVIALGTNDLMPVPSTPEVVPRLIFALYDRAHAAEPCFEIYVATLPPRRGIAPVLVSVTNENIRKEMQERGVEQRVIPFDLVDEEDMSPDGVHFLDAGQAHRAALAARVLFR